MNIKGLIIKNKKMVIGIVIALILGITGGMGELPKDEYNLLLVNKEQIEKETIELDEVIEVQKKENKALESKKIEKEKLIQAEKDKVVAEEKEKARLEAERIANEVRLAKEEAERLAQEQEDYNSTLVDNTTDEVGIRDTYVEETPVGEMVWLSATGSKYHRINNCGRMNPDTSRQVSAEEASQGYDACSKCY